MAELQLTTSCLSLKPQRRILPAGSLPSWLHHSQRFLLRFPSQIGVNGKGEGTEMKMGGR